MYVCVRVDLCMCARDAVLVQLLESIDFGWNWDKPRAREVFGAFRGIVSRFSMRFSGAMSAQRATFFFLQFVFATVCRFWIQPLVPEPGDFLVCSRLVHDIELFVT